MKDLIEIFHLLQTRVLYVSWLGRYNHLKCQKLSKNEKSHKELRFKTPHDTLSIYIYTYIYTVAPLMDPGHRIQDTCHSRDYTGHITKIKTLVQSLLVNIS